LPLIVVMMVFCWRAFPGVTLSPVTAMLLGLLTDIISGGPLGFWALLALIGASAGGYARAFGAGRQMGPLWLSWTLLAPVLAIFGWLLASAFFLRWVDWWPIAFGVVASVVLFPVVLKGLLWIERGSLGLGTRATYRGRA
jgi:rod shape-determining protein MreD